VLRANKRSVLSGSVPGGVGRLTVVVLGGQDDEVAMDILGGIWDTLVEVAGKIKGLLSCTPMTTTTVTLGSGDKPTTIVTTTTCVSS